jgi:hypothetical protein
MMMSRSGWSDDYDATQWDYIRWAGAQKAAINGARGQTMLRDLVTALDAMPVKELASHEWVRIDGPACALGVLGRSRGLETDMADLDPDNDQSPDRAAQMLGIAPTLARLVVWENDDAGPWNETPAERWKRIRDWVSRQIIAKPATDSAAE